MKRFEYQILKFDLRGGWFRSGGIVDDAAVGVQLNELGAEGWELATSVDTSQTDGRTRDLVLILKREIT